MNMGLGKCAINYNCCNDLIFNKSGKVFLFNFNKYKKSDFKQPLPKKQSIYKILT